MTQAFRILCPTDFSASSEHAFRYALLLAEALKARIQLLYAVFPEADPLDLPISTAQATSTRISQSKGAMQVFTDRGLAQMNGLIKQIPPVMADVEIGMPVRTITDVAKRDFIDLIVMGTHGKQKGYDRLFGSVAAGVVKHAECPVWVVPDTAEFRIPQRILYATDLHDADPYHIWKSAQLLQKFSPMFFCVHFNTPKNNGKDYEKMEALKAFFADHAPALQMSYHLLNGDDIEDELTHFIKAYDMDLLVMYQPKKGILEGLFHRSKSKKMVNFSRIPLLVQKYR